MSAVPKKKLCWNCEGNVSREMDNCPYCGVYVHSLEQEGIGGWNVPYPTPSTSDSEEVPSPLYKLHETTEAEDQVDLDESSYPSESIYHQLKKDVLPILLLMSGSLFFLFGIVLLLFSNNGTLTLQWNGNHWPYFLFVSLPCVYLGWKYLIQMESNKDR